MSSGKVPSRPPHEATPHHSPLCSPHQVCSPSHFSPEVLKGSFLLSCYISGTLIKYELVNTPIFPDLHKWLSLGSRHSKSQWVIKILFFRLRFLLSHYNTFTCYEDILYKVQSVHRESRVRRGPGCVPEATTHCPGSTTCYTVWTEQNSTAFIWLKLWS